jgi:para-nitrobenzyl esterase
MTEQPIPLQGWVLSTSTGATGWAPYDVTRRTTMRIAEHWLPADDPRGHERGAWH